MKKLYLSLLSVGFVASLLAQTPQTTGSVKSAENGAALPYASIRVAGYKTITTDKNGKFKLPCIDSAQLTVTHIGFESYRGKFACGQELNIQLKENSQTLDAVEISASSNPNKSMLYQPAAISRIGSTELNRGTGLLLDDAINTNVAGVYMQRRTFSAGQQFNIRGYGNGTRGTNGINSNFDGQGYKVYLNGIPITDAEGITLMDDIDFGSVGQVEIIKGPAGSLYGQAIAGVVNLKTKKPESGRSALSQDVLLGGYGLQRYTTSLQLSTEKSVLLVNHGRQHFDGFMPHTRSEKDFVNLMGEFNPNVKQTITSYFGYSNSFEERNGELTIGQYANLDYSGNQAYIKNNAHSNVKTFRAGIGHAYRFNANFSYNTTLFGTGLISDVSSAGGWTDKSAVNYGLRSTLDTRFELATEISLSGITGLELQQQQAQILGYPMVADSSNLAGYRIPGVLRSNQVTTTGSLLLFTEWTLAFPASFSITAGIGHSRMDISLKNRLYAPATTIPTRYSASYHNMYAPHLAVNKVFSEKVSLYASYSQGYKAPVSSYFFIPITGEVISGLKPEKANQWEIGTKGSLFKNRFQYEVAVFYTVYQDKMTTIAVPIPANTATSYVYVANAGEQKNLGLEISLKGTAYESAGFISAIHPFANLTLSHFRYGNFQYEQLSNDKMSTVVMDFTYKTVVGVPPVVFNTGFDLITRAGIYWNLTYNYRDPMYFTSDNKNQTASYQLLNTKIGYSRQLMKHFAVDVHLGCNNLTGQQNYLMVFLNQLPDAYLPAPREVNFFGGVNLHYIF
ncbi:TonB-dependent receptor [Flavihumibacter sp. UBA7668]|uniref:TonB-dependent receptor n=1 Tax=Flavihumibacter sp. UBA7668 TaxID=1946542 RepID=UPI0025C62812|nr:TonB-dependent receptor [Flavihumibacter sp. UBA7668]